jgi:D-alanine-D-alanine ligase
MRVALLYGGRSGEHEISIRSARSIYVVLKQTHDVFPIFIDKKGFWWRAPEGKELPTNATSLKEKIFLYPGVSAEPSLFTATSQLRVDIAFPVLHGTHGEDGIIQGLLESAGIPYVGADVAASADGMDKVTMKCLFEQNGLPVAPYVWFYRSEWKRDPEAHVRKIEAALSYPIFVKPANLGSSVGITKAHDARELREGIEDAAKYDSKILVEKGIDAREIECSVLGNQDAEASLPGELVPKREFYDYVAKYIEQTTEYHMPARLDDAETKQVQELSVRAFHAIGCSGMGRVDLLLERKTGTFYVNEINTIPGFTNISMYPKLWEVSGLPFPKLLDRLLELGLERFREQAQNITSYDLIQDP